MWEKSSFRSHHICLLLNKFVRFAIALSPRLTGPQSLLEYSKKSCLSIQWIKQACINMLIFNKIHFNSFDKRISFLKKKKKKKKDKQIRMTQMHLILTYLKGKILSRTLYCILHEYFLWNRVFKTWFHNFNWNCVLKHEFKRSV